VNEERSRWVRRFGGLWIAAKMRGKAHTSSLKAFAMIVFSHFYLLPKALIYVTSLAETPFCHPKSFVLTPELQSPRPPLKTRSHHTHRQATEASATPRLSSKATTLAMPQQSINPCNRPPGSAFETPTTSTLSTRHPTSPSA
jgi:hypothetical protein